MPEHDTEHDRPAVERAARLKERIYLTFAALAVILAMRSGEVGGVHALTTFAVTVSGTLAAILVADIVSHLLVHKRLFTGPELRHALRISVGAVSAVVLPFIFLVMAALGFWQTGSALRASAIALIAALVAIGYAAVRRAQLPFWQKVLVLAGEALLGLAVIALELLAHH